MNILIVGAGVIGTLYAAKLQARGHRVTVLARGVRLADIRRSGLELQDVTTGESLSTRVDTAEELRAEDRFDFALVTVRRDQLTEVLPVLAANHGIRTILFMLNNPTGSAALVDAVGHERILLGFPGAGGARHGKLVRYAMIPQQPTTLGELDGVRTERVTETSRVFKAAGFPTHICSHMDAWLKAHAFFVTAVAGAIYMAEGSCHQLSQNERLLQLMVKGVREGYAAVAALGLPVRPVSLKVMFTILPTWFSVRYWQRYFQSERASYVFGEHVQTAALEMREVARGCLSLLDGSATTAPTLRGLYRAIERHSRRFGNVTGVPHAMIPDGDHRNL